LLDGPSDLASKLTDKLRGRGATVVPVRFGERYATHEDGSYSVRAAQAEDYEALLGDLKSRQLDISQILHMGLLNPPDERNAGADTYAEEQERGFFSLFHLAQCLGKTGFTQPLSLGIVTNGMQQVAGEPVPCPGKATIIGHCRVLPTEMPNLRCRSIDVALPRSGSWQEQVLVEHLPNELLDAEPDKVVAYRGAQRFAQRFVPLKLPKAQLATRLKRHHPRQAPGV
jgi:hypothetical protein